MHYHGQKEVLLPLFFRELACSYLIKKNRNEEEEASKQLQYELFLFVPFTNFFS